MIDINTVEIIKPKPMKGYVLLVGAVVGLLGPNVICQGALNISSDIDDYTTFHAMYYKESHLGDPNKETGIDKLTGKKVYGHRRFSTKDFEVFNKWLNYIITEKI